MLLIQLCGVFCFTRTTVARSVPIFNVRMCMWASTCARKNWKGGSVLKPSLLSQATFDFRSGLRRKEAGNTTSFEKRSITPAGLVHRDGDTEAKGDRCCHLPACHAWSNSLVHAALSESQTLQLLPHILKEHFSPEITLSALMDDISLQNKEFLITQTRGLMASYRGEIRHRWVGVRTGLSRKQLREAKGCQPLTLEQIS